MRRFARLTGFLAAAGLASGDIGQARAQTPLDRAFNRTIAAGNACETAVRAYPFTVTGYPYNVARLQRALASTDSNERMRVGVVVFDNDFIGYDVDASGEAPNDDTAGQNRGIRAEPNFPKDFFLNAGNAFNPYFDEETRLTGSGSYETIDAESGHGTSIVGIILGGKYDDDAEPAEGNLNKPNVRTLFMDGAGAGAAAGTGTNTRRSWIQLSFVPVDYGTTEANSTDPIGRLGSFFGETDGAPPNVDIINMSFGQTVTDGRTLKLDIAVRGVLIVAAAGNNEREVPGPGLNGSPISADHKGIMLVVASHNADGTLSQFSNYGRNVTIAAPGCAIESWIDGVSAARPLSGTSMATAMVSFAAALVRSRWRIRNVGTGLRNRLISSARYEKALVKCTPALVADECVKSGSMLDIEAAVLLNRDYIEYQRCWTDQAGRHCDPQPHIAIGTLGATPKFLGVCMESLLLNSPLYVGRAGMSYNGALKRTGANTFSVFYEPLKKVGLGQIEKRDCAGPDNPAETLVTFQAEGVQLDGSPASAEPINVPISEVLRIVVRAF